MAERRAKHPGKTPAQRRVLDAIGCGNFSPSMARATRKALLDAGLIEKAGEKIIGRGWSAVTIDEFHMPIPVHYAWCKAVADAEFSDD